MNRFKAPLAVLALAATTSAAFAQINYEPVNYQPDTGVYDLARAFLFLPELHVDQNDSTTLTQYGPYSSAYQSEDLDTATLGLNSNGIYGFESTYGSAFMSGGASYLSGSMVTESYSDITLGQYGGGSLDFAYSGISETFDFTVAGGYYSFQALATIDGDTNADTFYVSLWGVGASGYFSILTYWTSGGTPNWKGYLDPGEYHITARSNSVVGDIYGVYYVGGSSSLAFSLARATSVPGPAAVLPFAAGALLRRRRR